MDKDSVANKLKGNLNQGVGAAREKAGEATGQAGMERKGAEQHAKGDAQETVGKVQGATSDFKNSAKVAVEDAADQLKAAVGR